MIIDLNEKLIGYDNEPIRVKGTEKEFTVKRVLLDCLTLADGNIPYNIHLERYELYKTIKKMNEVDLTEDNIIMFKPKIWIAYLRTDIIGIMNDIFENKSEKTNVSK